MSARLLTATLVITFWLSLFGSAVEAKCRTKACWGRVHVARANAWCHRHDHCLWRKRFERLPAGWRNWAHRTSWCEARHNAHTNTGNGFYGGFQYTLQTAWVAGFTRRPDLTTWWEQGVRSIRYAERNGTGAWPVCGR